jgi:hypothetical protein
LVTIRENETTYLALPVPKGSYKHKINVKNFSEAYLSYQLCQNSVSLTPYKLSPDAEIVGLASSASDPLKQLLMRNNLILREWTNCPTPNSYEELLIVELHQD